MGTIYCLYSTEDCQPRYVGQTTQDAKYRFKQHITRALEYEEGVLYDWMRSVWKKNYNVEFYILQDNLIPNDLELYERYWIDQFGGLVNVRHNSELEAKPKNSQIGERVKKILKKIDNSN